MANIDDMSNIQINVTNSMPAYSQNEKIVTYAPAVVYVESTYPTELFDIQSSSSNGDPFHSVSFNRTVYNSAIGNRIFFAIFPVGHSQNKIETLKKYTTMTDQQLKKYATLSITPEGNFITSPLICDRIFNQNGLYSDDQNAEKNLTQEDGKYYLSSNASVTVFNWKINNGYIGVLGSDGSVISSSTLSVMTQNFGISVERGVTNKKSEQLPTFRYIGADQNFTPLYGVQKMQFAKDAKKYAYRSYVLDNWWYAHPQTNTQTIDGLPIEKFPFFFMLKLSPNTRGTAVLSFGASQSPIQIIFQQDKVQLAIGAEKNRKKTTLDLGYSELNPPTLPFYAKSMLGAKTLIIYPTYLGVSVQPGVWQAGLVAPVGNKYNISRTGGFCQFGGILNAKQKYQRKFPTFQDWLRIKPAQQNGSTTNIYSYPWALPWGTTGSGSTQLKLQFKNTNGNFFYSPLLFLQYAKFRMYFKGIKAGKYDPKTKKPYGGDNGASNDQCAAEVAIEYSYKSKVDESNNKVPEFVEAIQHTYYGSVLFTCEYVSGDVAGGSANATADSTIAKVQQFITCPTIARRIPPPPVAQVDDEFWLKDYSMDSYYFDFQLNVNDNGDGLSRLPVQIQGVLILQKSNMTKSLLKNGNGSFTMQIARGLGEAAEGGLSNGGVLPIYQNTCSDIKTKWYTAITQMQVTHNEQGSNGTITLDKYVLMQQTQFPKQCIGAITATIFGGNPSIINSTPTGTSGTYRQGKNILFSGYVTKMSMSDSKSSDTITLTLQGIQKKLTDLKLINPPFWDGDPLKKILDWLGFYAGVNIYQTTQGVEIVNRQYIYDKLMTEKGKKYKDQNGVQRQINTSDLPITPVSSVFARPAVNYKSGTDCFQALKDVCFQKCNHRFVIQPDSNAYVFTQNKIAIPWKPCTIGQCESYIHACINQNLILTFSMQPLMANLYNFIISASLRGDKQGTKEKGGGDPSQGIQLNKQIEQIQFDQKDPLSVEIPWSKAMALKHEGFMSEQELQKQHNRNVMLAKNYWINLKISIPGNTNIWIYDVVKLFGNYYYVTQVSHSVDMTTKSFKTDVTLCSCIEDPK